MHSCRWPLITVEGHVYLWRAMYSDGGQCRAVRAIYSNGEPCIACGGPCIPMEGHQEGTEREAPGPAFGIRHVHESYF